MHSLGTNEIKEEPPKKEEVKVKKEVKKVEVTGGADDLGTFSIGNVKD